MRIDVITIFPQYLTPLRESLLGKAIERGQLRLGIHDLREQTTDRHRTVDDAPYGGGPGMVMKPDVWAAALDAVLDAGDIDAADAPGGPAAVVGAGDAGGAGDAVGAGEADGAGEATGAGAAGGAADAVAGPMLIVPTPAGRPFTQAVAAELAQRPWLIFAPARYEGIDQRFVDDAATRMPVAELSIGDYVLAGGEAAVLVMVEAVARLLPGVLGNPDSAVDDSFGTGLPGLLEAPSYTRPPVFRGLPIPAELTTGNHAKIARYRRDESLRRTAAHRPELIAGLPAEALQAADYQVLRAAGAPIPAGLAERVEAELLAAERRRAARRQRRTGTPPPADY